MVVVGKDQISCDLEGEAAILNLKDGAYYGLNEVGASVWQLIQTPLSVSQIRDALLDRFEVDPERCTKDLIELLSELVDLGLVEVRNGSDR
jgi:hypothetical protein